MNNAFESLADKKSLNHFFLKLAVEKTTAKLAAAGMTADQAAEFLTRPGHVVDLLNFAKDLHIQAIDRVLANA